MTNFFPSSTGLGTQDSSSTTTDPPLALCGHANAGRGSRVMADSFHQADYELPGTAGVTDGLEYPGRGIVGGPPGKAIYPAFTLERLGADSANDGDWGTAGFEVSFAASERCSTQLSLSHLAGGVVFQPNTDSESVPTGFSDGMESCSACAGKWRAHQSSTSNRS